MTEPGEIALVDQVLFLVLLAGLPLVAVVLPRHLAARTGNQRHMVLVELVVCFGYGLMWGVLASLLWSAWAGVVVALAWMLACGHSSRQVLLPVLRQTRGVHRVG